MKLINVSSAKLYWLLALIMQTLLLRATKPLDLVMGSSKMYHSKYFSLSLIGKLEAKNKLRVKYSKVIFVKV